MINKNALLGASLFSSGGIGDLALRAAGVEILVANELIEDRASVYQTNFPACRMIVGDIRELEHPIVQTTKERLDGRELDILFATPPCQGMSKNSRGWLLNAARAGRRPEMDPRNALVINAMNVMTALDARTLIMENVPEMQSTLIEADGECVDILSYVRSRLDRRYTGSWAVIEFADYGVPQRRQRLITVFSRDEHLKSLLEIGPAAWLAQPTHSANPSLFSKLPWHTVTDAIGHLPPLDAKDAAAAASSIPFHRVPLLDEDKYFWVSNTPPGKGAFDNQCVNSACGYQENPTHGASHGKDGINRAHKTTPLRCIRCGHLLPRPWVRSQNGYKLMAGFTSAYKRMRGDLPASALTRNLSYACSDQKLHPTQNRVLSLHEAMIIHTVGDYDYRWSGADGRTASDKLIRELLAESIPPKGFEQIVRHLFSTSAERKAVSDRAA